MSRLTLGIDIGGTNIKFGVVDPYFHIIKRYSIPTEVSTGDKHVVSRIICMCREIMKSYSVSRIGIGTSGQVDSAKGIVIESTNVPYHNTPIVAILEEDLGIPVFVENDAVCALFGEMYAGIGSEYRNFIMVTLGTGVGGGICINGKPYYGRNGMAGEFGHATINFNGETCLCGEKGCYEYYASVTALIRQAGEAIAKAPGSLLAQICREGVNGKRIFDAAQCGCDTAAQVIEQYVTYVAVGIKNLIMTLGPEAVIIGGAISSQEEWLIKPLQKIIGSEVQIHASTLKNDAGIMGAAVIAQQR